MSSHLTISAQFNPDSPAEPFLNNKITVKAEPVAAVSWLRGEGYYREGETVYLNSSRSSGIFTFSHWEKDGEWFSDSESPTFTADKEEHTFTVHYIYSPSSPDEPLLIDNRVYLVAEPLSACSFNIVSGKSFNYDQLVDLNAYANQGYSFLGWYKDGIKQSESLNFLFNMPQGDVRLVAKFEYNPFNPAEPEQDADNPQDNVQTTPTGDSDGDGVIDVADAVHIINLSLINTYQGKADVDCDGVVDVADAVASISICLKTK